MPVRSLRSHVLRWPDRETVHAAVARWAEAATAGRGDVVRIGYAGSYARGNWGVGSDVDLVVVVRESVRPRSSRALDWDATDLPVPADVLVYTAAEWSTLEAEGHDLTRHTVWVWSRP